MPPLTLGEVETATSFAVKAIEATAHAEQAAGSGRLLEDALAALEKLVPSKGVAAELGSKAGSLPMDILSHEGIGHDLTPSPQEWRAAIERITKPLNVLPRLAEDVEPSAMRPPAFKILREGGISDYDRVTKYPLPEFRDGKWIPGNWVEPGQSPLVGAIQSFTRKEGIFLTDRPGVWGAGQKGMETYEVEIGDAPSRARWQTSYPELRSDFTAQRIRLLRPLTAEELPHLDNPLFLREEWMR